MARSKNLADAIRAKLARDQDLNAAVTGDRFSVDLSTEVYRLRKEAGLTQEQLAQKIGTRQSVIARLEDADYDGHSLKLLNRIAEATGKRLEVRFVDDNFSPVGNAVKIDDRVIEWMTWPTEWPNDSVTESGEGNESELLCSKA